MEGNFHGVVDLVSMKALYFDGPNGEKIRSENIPDPILKEAEKKREELLEAASMFSDELMEAIFDDTVNEALICNAVRTALSQEN